MAATPDTDAAPAAEVAEAAPTAEVAAASGEDSGEDVAPDPDAALLQTLDGAKATRLRVLRELDPRKTSGGLKMTKPTMLEELGRTDSSEGISGNVKGAVDDEGGVVVALVARGMENL